MSTSLLLNFEGANGSTTITDESGIGKTTNLTGGAAITTSTAFKGSSSLNLPNSNSSLTVQHSAAEMALTNDFSIHFGMRRAGAVANGKVFTSSDGFTAVSMDGTGVALTARLELPNVVSPTNPIALPANEWHAVGLTRIGLLFRAFFDGYKWFDARASSLVTANISTLTLGSSSTCFIGQIDNLLIDKGTALWTLAYDPMTMTAKDTLNAMLLDAPNSKEAFAASWPVLRELMTSLSTVRNIYHGGRGRISGTVKVKGTPNFPKYAPVFLFRERDMMLLAAQWSNPATGAYQFDGWDETQRYTVLAYDTAKNFRAVVADNLSPEVYL